jgi:muramoyltetrapeptide carboxypeptidase
MAFGVSFRKPRALRRGDRVAVVAPAGPFERECLETGLGFLAQRYRVQSDPRLFERHRYLAGQDSRRLAELVAALSDPEIGAVFCARGGYGAMRLLGRLPALPTHGALKPLIGFSDITALHQWLQRQGVISIHGPGVTQLGRLSDTARERLYGLLESAAPAAALHGTSTLVAGTAEGPLLGGNLSVFTRLLGTPWLPALQGAVLLLEDVGERPYRLDRMWTHLELAGVFRQVSGIVLGSFTGCEEKGADYSSDEVLRELAAGTGLPCAAGFPIGHGDRNDPVPLGARVRLEADSKRLEFLEAATVPQSEE